MDKSKIIREIKLYLGFKNDTELADFLGIKQNTLSTWKSRNTMDYDLVISKCDFIDANWLLTGEGEMLKEPTPEDKQSKLQKIREIADTSTKKNNLIPFYEDVATISGTSISADTSAVANTTTYIDAGDWFKGEVSAAIRHYGDSMVEYSNGCILALKTITNQRNIVWGHNYVVETDEIRVTKRLQTCPEDKNCIMAYSTNTETYPDGTLIHEPFKIHKEDIKRIFLVIGSIHKEYGTEAVFIRK